MGLKAYAGFQLFFGAGTLCLLLNPVFWVLAVVWFASRLHLIQSVSGPVLYLGTIALFVGNAACVLSVVGGRFGRRNYEDVKSCGLGPLVLVADVSRQAWKALVQLFTKPTHWEKTDHGFCQYEEYEMEEAGTSRRPVLVDIRSAS